MHLTSALPQMPALGAGVAGPEDHINAMPLLLLPPPPAWGLGRARLSCEPGSGTAAALSCCHNPWKGGSPWWSGPSLSQRIGERFLARFPMFVRRFSNVHQTSHLSWWCLGFVLSKGSASPPATPPKRFISVAVDRG